MNLNVMKKGFNYAQDGPGNRLVYHLQGCNMRCPWCSNPESLSTEGIGVSILSPDSMLSYTPTSVEAMLQEAEESRRLFFDGGGVTLTGGEPTLDFEALKAFLTGLKANNINTAIETNGTHSRLPELFPLLDLLIIDLKHIDSDIHLAMTGLPNQVILENIKQALLLHPNILVRTPLVNGFNSDKETITKMMDFYKQFDTSHASFEFLKYHEFGKSKWQACGLPYTIKTGYISDSLYRSFEKIYADGGLKVVRT